jgi:hypothetical protein
MATSDGSDALYDERTSIVIDWMSTLVPSPGIPGSICR